MPTYVVVTDQRWTTEATTEKKAVSNIYARMAMQRMAELKLDASQKARVLFQVKRDYPNAVAHEKDTLTIGVVGCGNPRLESDKLRDFMQSFKHWNQYGIKAIYVPTQAGLPELVADFAKKNGVTVIQLQPGEGEKPEIQNVQRIADECDRIYIPIVSGADYSPEMNYLGFRLRNRNTLSKLLRL